MPGAASSGNALAANAVNNSLTLSLLVSVPATERGFAMLRRHGFDLIVTCVCLTLLGFFGWHAQNGKRSFANQKIVVAQVSELEEKRDRIRARREAFEARVTLMRPENLDPDMLDEMSRRMLGFTRNNEIVVSD